MRAAAVRVRGSRLRLINGFGAVSSPMAGCVFLFLFLFFSFFFFSFSCAARAPARLRLACL